MRILPTLLAKDLREQRLALLAPWGLGLAVSLVAALLVDPAWLDTPVFAQVLALSLGALCALAIGCDLGSRERGEGSLPWLLRQPFGFGHAITSKLAVLALGMLLGLGAGALFAYATSAWVAGGQAAFGLGRTEGILIAIVVALGLWSTSASTWMPRGFLAAPAGLVSFVLLAAPAWIPIVWYELRPDPELGRSLALSAVLGGLLAALAGLSGGVRDASGPARRAALALGAGALGCLPLWIAAARQTADVLRFDANAERFEILGAYVAADGGHALLNAWEGRVDWRRRPVDVRPIAVELATGAWRPVGPRGSQVRPADPGSRSDAWLLEDPTGVLALLRADGTPIPTVDRSSADASAGDAPTAPRGLRLHRPAGSKWSVRAASGPAYEGWFDPEHGLTFTLVELWERGLERGAWQVLGTRGPWLLTEDRHARAGGPRHALYDAARRELSYPAWLAPLRQVVGVLADGRVVGLFEEPGGSGLALLDPTSGEREPLPVLGAPAILESVHAFATPRHAPLDRPGSPTLLSAQTPDRRVGLLWLDPAAEPAPHARWSELRPGPFDVVGPLGADDLLLARDGALWAQSFSGRPERRIFPR